MNFYIRHPWVVFGKDVHVQWDVEIFSPSKILKIGNHVGINRRTVIQADVEIGNHVLIAGHCGLVARDAHSYRIVESTIYNSPRADKYKIIISDDVWIGFGSTILSGVTIGEGAVIAANSLVIHDVEPYSIVAGNPAKKIKMRFDSSNIEKHKQYLESLRSIKVNSFL